MNFNTAKTTKLYTYTVHIVVFLDFNLHSLVCMVTLVACQNVITHVWILLNRNWTIICFELFLPYYVMYHKIVDGQLKVVLLPEGNIVITNTS